MLLAAAATTASALPGTFSIAQVFSNADGTVQFVVIHDRGMSDCDSGENRWFGLALVSSGPGALRSYTFPSDLPTCATSGRNMLIATQGFAALGLVTPDYVIPDKFLQIPSGSLNFAGVDSVTYTSLPTDGVKAINGSGAQVQNVATNLAGESASVTPAAVAISPVPGIWANPNEDGTGYALDYHNGILVLAIYSYQAGGPAQWYLAAGPVVANVFTATLDRYTGGQCISCAFTGKPTLAGNDGTITVKFTSSTAATVNLPNGRVTQISPFVF